MLVLLEDRKIKIDNQSDAKWLHDKFKLLHLLQNEKRGLIEAPKCGHCGLPMTGRSDKKFCNGICRSAFNNKKSAE